MATPSCVPASNSETKPEFQLFKTHKFDINPPTICSTRCYLAISVPWLSFFVNHYTISFSMILFLSFLYRTLPFPLCNLPCFSSSQKLSLVSVFLSILVYISPDGLYDKSMSNTDFYKRVAIVCKHIPYGKVASYGQIALLCQKPQNSRQVGFALGRKIKEDVNAHRVINSQGYLSGAGCFDI